METRPSLRAAGEEVLEQLEHGTRPPRARPLYLSTVPGLAHYTTEALWGSVWARPVLSLRDRIIATMAVLVTLQRMRQLRTYLNSALNLGMAPTEVHEVAIQCSLHAGFPVTVNALDLLRDVLEARGDVVALPEVPEDSIEELDRRGRELYHALFGRTPDLTGNEATAVLTTLELRYGFGEILSRPGLDRRARVIVALAASLAQRDEAEVALWRTAGDRVGLGATECDEVLLQCAHYAGLAASRRALQHG